MIHRSYGNNPDVAYCRKMRKEFEKLKKKPVFNSWKRQQYKIQKGRCAWCRCMMDKDYIDVHVDHALALFHGGTNKYSNLVLSHGKCNVEKWIRIDGVPNWIVVATKNYRTYQRLERLRKEQFRQLKQLTEDNYNEELAESLRWIT